MALARFWLVLLTVELTRILLVADLLAVGLDLWFELSILLCLDDRPSVDEPFLLNNRSVADTLVSCWRRVGKQAVLSSASLVLIVTWLKWHKQEGVADAA